ncbi:MAG: SpoVR family protein [Bacteroidetes bacterium]|nr:SpoVR family protein [Bacteroidota bacterium]
MQLINQHTKRIMEGCKERALDAGLSFDKETLEYFVTNMDMLDLSPKNMIPTLYDYWLQDIQGLRGKGEYEAYPNNPYETVINTRPVISFYNDNNPDWLNVMIFYHVLGHIDFFQNNKFFKNTWDYDFKEKALTEKRIIAKLRAKKGRVVDYILEFAKSIDNIVGFFDSLIHEDELSQLMLPKKIDYYFNVFLQKEKNIGMIKFLEELETYNEVEDGGRKEDDFLLSILNRYPEFEEFYKNYKKDKQKVAQDLLQFILEESPFLNKDDNKWMKSVVDIMRDTALYFAPMIRTKTMNEGWASYWHEKLFMNDDRILGHEVGFAKINAKVTSISKVGLNPYAIGWRLFMFVEEMADKGRISYDFRKLKNIDKRENYDKKNGSGKDFIFHVRENYSDLTFLNSFIDQDFVDKHKLMVVGQRINPQKGTREYYVKSKKAKDYKEMIISSLYHPPYIQYSKVNGELILNHTFEGKEIYREYIPAVLIGLEYLWGNTVKLETTEYDWEEMQKKAKDGKSIEDIKKEDPVLQKVRYSVKNKKITKEKLIMDN